MRDRSSHRREPEPLRLLDPGQVQSKENAPSDVTQRIAGRRDPVDLVIAGNVRQERVIEDKAAVGADIGQNEQAPKPGSTRRGR